jgi:hypothetical protein
MVCLFWHENLWSPWQQNDFETENEYEKAWILTQSHTLLHTRSQTRSQTRSRSTIPGSYFFFFCCRTKEEKEFTKARNQNKPYPNKPSPENHTIHFYYTKSNSGIPSLYKTYPMDRVPNGAITF